ncbi:protein GAMETOPHYTE DEFECTIVE 1 [Argentina anserina]|uniref:protein GAMETOPHYTE DEFECTIVE 1 n=1 Tax=Argentina anserina TaxID=57926 RepID=UPI0021762456|nr:protein GAMETOPHYTE DEFECTIVE 1 [Potentilla anserina]
MIYVLNLHKPFSKTLRNQLQNFEPPLSSVLQRAMGFFDLGIPYTDLPPLPDRSTRAKLVTKALELGYAGVAYNRTIKGVMSDRDRCSIPLLTLPSLLKLSPHLTSSVAFHRDLLSVPRATPFRQYTRLTVCAETPAQAQALNYGNPVLKTYDLVAVKPMNQSAFEQACEKLEVDIIAIDFSESLPFRLKQHLVKAAMERNVYFEITYAGFIADVRTRRQIITNAKLLVDWTRGRNIIISSAAPTANEFRGPYDVANLMSLLGLSVERAKAAVSRNCRTLISNAMRKKHYHKEAIRVEVLPSGQEIDKPWSSDSFNWDPISSGEGDLLLDDLAKAFSNSSTKATKTVKSTNFASVVDSMPSLGFQVKDDKSGPSVGVAHALPTQKNIFSNLQLSAQSIAADGVQEQFVLCDTLLKRQRFKSEHSQKWYAACDTKAVNNVVEIEDPAMDTRAGANSPDETDAITIEILNAQSQKSDVANAINEVMDIEICASTGAEPMNSAESMGIKTEIYDVQLLNSVTAETFRDAMEIEAPITTGAETKNPDGIDGFATEIQNVQQRSMTDCQLNVHAVDIGLSVACNPDSEVEVPTNYQDSEIPCPHYEETDSVNIGDTQSDLVDAILTGKEKEFLPLGSVLDNSIPEMDELRESEDDAVALALSSQVPVLDSNDEMTVNDDFSVANHGTAVVIRDEQEHGKADGSLSYSALVQSDLGKSKARRKKPHQVGFLPLKRLLYATPFKKVQKSKRRHKKA